MIRTLRILLLLVFGGALLLLSALLILHAGADAWLVNSLAGRVIPGTTASVGSAFTLTGAPCPRARSGRGDGRCTSERFAP